MAALPYMQLYVADYLADTMHLTTEEHGAYLLLIFNYWQTGKPIPKVRLSRIARVPSERWPEIQGALSEFFEDDGESWIHLRIERDIAAVLTAPRGKNLPGSESLLGFKGYVYFVTEPSSDLVKIGYSKNPWARLSELRRSHGVELSVAATIKTVEKSEVSVHELLAEFRSEGEWFCKSSCITDLIAAISGGSVTTVEGICNYVASYATPTVATEKPTTSTTNKDLDKDKKKSFTPKPPATATPQAKTGNPRPVTPVTPVRPVTQQSPPELVCEQADRANRLAEINQAQIREALGVPVDPEAARAQLFSRPRTSGVHGNA
ncbi:DUF1376 domain-containing protein [Pseudomonas sp. NPDC098747]|uniref:DUF1376 domain-containing protein n=1 Tax=Pseudomonas sp. NPDC098747 TaxID=3364487 RepID=UPI00383A6D3D